MTRRSKLKIKRNLKITVEPFSEFVFIYYVIDGVKIECDFTNIANGTVLTRYHAIDYERIIKPNDYIDPDKRNAIIYQDEQVIKKLKEKPSEIVGSHICYQSIEELCSPYIQLLYSLKEMTGCDCKRYFKTFNEGVIV